MSRKHIIDSAIISMSNAKIDTIHFQTELDYFSLLGYANIL